MLGLQSKPHCALHLIPHLISAPLTFLPFFPITYPSSSNRAHSAKPAPNPRLFREAVSGRRSPRSFLLPELCPHPTLPLFDSPLIVPCGPVLPLQLCCRALCGAHACVPSDCPRRSHVKRGGCWVVARPGVKSNTCVTRGEMIGWGLGGSGGFLIQRQEISWGRGKSNQSQDYPRACSG